MMKKMISMLILCLAMVMAIGLGTVAFAAETGDSSAVIESGNAKKDRPRKDSTVQGSARMSVVTVAASVLGQTEEEIKEYFKTGKVGDLLINTGKVEDFKAAYLSETKTKLDTAVSAGTLTQVQADEKYAQAQSKISTYDGTTHLCGGTDHSKILERGDKPAKASSKTA